MNRLLGNLGFYSDPFASTNADDEPQLADYFVPPPYFAAVKGDPRNPRPNIVLAPRGGGKTAQKRMIEAASSQQDFICVAYDRFETPAGFDVSEATLEYHLTQVCRLITVAILVALESDRATVDNLDAQQKRVVKFCTNDSSVTSRQTSSRPRSRRSRTLGIRLATFGRRGAAPLPA